MAGVKYKKPWRKRLWRCITRKPASAKSGFCGLEFMYRVPGADVYMNSKGEEVRIKDPVDLPLWHSDEDL